MCQRQAVDFLRRRYASAILCDDADTAGRLRAQLDALMNAGKAPAVSEPALRGDAASTEGKGDRTRFAPQLCAAAPATGLLTTRRPLPRTPRPISAAPDQR